MLAARDHAHGFLTSRVVLVFCDGLVVWHEGTGAVRYGLVVWPYGNGWRVWLNSMNGHCDHTIEADLYSQVV